MTSNQSVTTTIEKICLEEGRELQWIIRNFNIIHSSSLDKIEQSFGPLNGKVLIKLDLTKKDDSNYEVGLRIEPFDNVAWVNFYFKMHGVINSEFSISGHPENVPSNRLSYNLNIPSQDTITLKFKPEILLSRSTVPSNNNQWLNDMPEFIKQILSQHIAEGQHWINFIRNYPSQFAQFQQSLIGIFANSELIRQTPRMAQDLLNEIRNNPEYATLNQSIQNLLSSTRQQFENLQSQAQNQENIASFPLLMERAQQLLQQPSTQELLQSTYETVRNVYESTRNNPIVTAYAERYQSEFAQLQQAYQLMMDEYSTRQQNNQEPQTTDTEVEIEQVASQPNVVVEKTISAPTESTITVEETITAPHENEGNWSFIFTARNISGYVRQVKSLGQRIPFHRSFCAPETWKLPDGNVLKLELVHALHPDAPFICLFDYDTNSDLAFVQTLLDGNGQEIHKIDSFSNSYHGFSCDQLLQSAEIDDQVRIRIEAIPNMD